MSRPATTFTFSCTVNVVKDRYDGTYSGALYTAWAGEPPSEISDDDVTCTNFWYDNKRPCGKGGTPREAFENFWKVIHGT